MFDFCRGKEDRLGTDKSKCARPFLTIQVKWLQMTVKTVQAAGQRHILFVLALHFDFSFSFISFILMLLFFFYFYCKASFDLCSMKALYKTQFTTYCICCFTHRGSIHLKKKKCICEDMTFKTFLFRDLDL